MVCKLNVLWLWLGSHRSDSVVEDDPNTGKFYIGRGCYPNSEGIVQLDAAIMRGYDCSFGAVAALERCTWLSEKYHMIK